MNFVLLDGSGVFSTIDHLSCFIFVPECFIEFPFVFALIFAFMVARER